MQVVGVGVIVWLALWLKSSRITVLSAPLQSPARCFMRDCCALQKKLFS